MQRHWAFDEEKMYMAKRLTTEQEDKLMATGFVENVHANGKILYRDSFYVAMHNKIKEGMTYVEAYESLGFPVEWLGKERANACGKRAEQMAKDGTLNTLNPSLFDGSAPSGKMGLSQMTQEEQLAYLKARVNYLETVQEVKKTALYEYAASHISSSKTTK